MFGYEVNESLINLIELSQHETNSDEVENENMNIEDQTKHWLENGTREETEKIDLLQILCAMPLKKSIYLPKMLKILLNHFGMNKKTYKILKRSLLGMTPHEHIQDRINENLNEIQQLAGNYNENEDKDDWHKNMNKLVLSLKDYEQMKRIIDDYTSQILEIEIGRHLKISKFEKIKFEKEFVDEEENIKIKNTTTNNNLKENDENMKNCIICTDEIKDGENTTTIECGHIFHEQCLKKWIEVKTNCPICRFQFGIDLNDDEQHDEQENHFSFIMNGNENMMAQTFNEVLNDMMFRNHDFVFGQSGNNDNMNSCVMVMVRMHHRLLENDIPFNEKDVELQSNIEMLHQKLQSIEETHVGGPISIAIEHTSIVELIIEHRVSLYNAIMERIDHVFSIGEEELQNLENVCQEEVEQHILEIEEMRQMSRQQHEHKVKMQLFTLLKVLPFIHILEPQIELLNSILEENVENGVEILQSIERILPHISETMVNLNVEAVRNAMQNSHDLYQIAQHMYTEFNNLYERCSNRIEVNANAENFVHVSGEEEIPSLIGSSDFNDSDIPCEESDGHDNLNEQIYFQNFEANDIFQILEEQIQIDFTVPIPQIERMPISNHLSVDLQNEQNNGSIFDEILDEIIFAAVQQLREEEEYNI